MIGLIGGTGVYDSKVFKPLKEVAMKTPFGQPSDKIKILGFGDTKVAFLPRHGDPHTIPPHKVNYRANIWALKELGVDSIISLCAVGSLKEEIKPGHVMIPDQFIDMTKSRLLTFYENDKVVHISAADPFCPDLRELAIKTIKNLKLPVHPKGTYICIEGPRFSTRAESMLWQKMGADVVGMTLVPEAQLAMEAELCYLSICTITDYDVWSTKPVEIKEVVEIMKKSQTQLQEILSKIIPVASKERSCNCKNTLKDAVIG